MLLEEFDSNRNAVINAFDLIEPIQNFPQIAVSCFSRITFDRLLKELNGVPIATTGVANMEIPIYRVSYNGIEIALFISYVGAAGCVAVLEDLFAMGVEKIVLFGTCGVLDADIKDCSIIIPNVAVRDEGTSFHYATASDEINVNVKYQEEFIEILKSHKCSYTVGKVWTTDGIYRETREKVNKRKKDGCICVDMECSAVAALADFRGKEIFHFFYAADNLDNDNWDIRSLANSSNVLEKDRIALLAMELAAKIL
ncbi:nucleoside phosphorylase [Anaerocolumna sp. MB42-C2]|uniref:nucleoside phosphorylase n=1 Tax=Anaerocolumna sp. MB42-C2 TaxID=3070997 RepID=UPI0027DEFEED|nr:nucleoside phosphorylase [Anaerocolumna sp. MB42-C2]WMJ86315.1 nucleoside phosphorylase [Anaerocolumna sp. MB42-C2]